MINKSSRYDILVNNDYEQLNLDFILPKPNEPNEKMIHGTIWDDSDIPQKVSSAVVMVYVPGPTYYESDPNDIKCIGSIVPDSNGEFVIGPFKLNSTVIIKIFNTKGNKTNLSDEIPEEFIYINGEVAKNPQFVSEHGGAQDIK